MRHAAPYFLLGVLALLVWFLLRRCHGRTAVVAREFLLAFPIILLYFIARGLADANPTAAAEHAEAIIGIERGLGLFREPDVQRLAGSGWWIRIFNWIYIFGHWPVVAITFLWLAACHRERLPRYRDALFISGAIGIVIFTLLPVSPPRFMPAFGFIDPILLRNPAYRVLQPSALTNPYAAMPSLHLGWNLLMGIAVIRESRNRFARLFGVIMPGAMFCAIVVTANHYFLDGLVGVAIALLALALTDSMGNRKLAGTEAPASGGGGDDRGPRRSSSDSHEA